MRTLIIVLLIYFIFRYILRRFFKKILAPSLPRNQGEQHDSREKLHPCPTCGTYNPSRIAFSAEGNYFCNQECYQRRNQ